MSSRAFLSTGFRLVAALSAALFYLPCLAQQPKVLAPHKPVAPRLPDSPPPSDTFVQRSLRGGFWMTDAYTKASVYLRNDLEISSLSVNPVLYLSNGVKLSLPAVTMHPNGTAIINVNDALATQGISPYATLSGYVELQYQWPWDALCATVVSVDVTRSVIFTYGLNSISPSPSMPRSGMNSAAPVPGQQGLEGAWWKQEPNVTGFVALSNTTEQPLPATVQVLDANAKPLGAYQVTVSPHGTKRVELQELASLANSLGGLHVAFNGLPDALVVNGSLEDLGKGYSASIPFARPPDRSAKSCPLSYAEVGLMTGEGDSMMHFPAGTVFTPYSVARNLADQPVAVTPVIYWMTGASALSARLVPFTLNPLQTKQLDMPSLLAQAGLQHFNGTLNLVLEFQGVSGSVLAASGSVDQNDTYVFEVGPRGVGVSASKNVSNWSTANGDDTMVTVWNPADEDQDFVFTVYFSGGHYLHPMHLGPRTTYAFNVSELISNQIPDSEGNVIPLFVNEGAARLSGALGENQTILVAMDAGVYNVRKATCHPTCVTCSGANGFSVNPNPFALPVSGTAQLTLTARYNSGSQYNITASSTWSSKNTGVATVNSSALVSGVAVGSADITGDDPNIPLAVRACGEPPDCSGFVGGGATAPGDVTPLITSINPSQGAVGTTVPVVISGTGFGNVPTNVTIGTASAIAVTVTAVSDNGTTASINATFAIPPNASVGTVPVQVLVKDASGSSQPSNTVNFTVTGAIPTNFTSSSGTPLNYGALFFTYSWSSSSGPGRLADLSSCTAGESVYYPGFPNSFTWPPPMVNKVNPNNPTVISGSASGGGIQDTNYGPDSFQQPYTTAGFPATQRFWWSCPYWNSGNINYFVPDITITRSVFKDTDGFWKYRIQKSGYTNVYKLPGQ